MELKNFKQMKTITMIFGIVLFIIQSFFVITKLNADTLEEVLKLSYSTNKQLIFSRIKLKSNKKSIDISKSALGLNLSASINGSRSWDIDPSPISDQYSSSIIGGYNLYDGNLSKSNIQLNEALYNVAKFQLYDLEQKILLETVNAYLNVLRDQKLIELGMNNVSVLERQFLEISDRFKLGEVTRTDVSQAESALAAAKANLTAKNGSLKISSEMFLSLVGIKPLNLDNIKINFKLPKTVDIAKKNSLKKHPKILVAKIEEQIAKIRVDISKSVVCFIIFN